MSGLTKTFLLFTFDFVWIFTLCFRLKVLALEPNVAFLPNDFFLLFYCWNCFVSHKIAFIICFSLTAFFLTAKLFLGISTGSSLYTCS